MPCRRQFLRAFLDQIDCRGTVSECLGGKAGLDVSSILWFQKPSRSLVHLWPPYSDSASDSSEHWELISLSVSQGSNTVPDSTAASSPWWLRPPPSTLPFYLADSARKLRAECGYSGFRRLELAFQRGLQASRVRKGGIFQW